MAPVESAAARLAVVIVRVRLVTEVAAGVAAAKVPMQGGRRTRISARTSARRVVGPTEAWEGEAPQITIWTRQVLPLARNN